MKKAWISWKLQRRLKRLRGCDALLVDFGQRWAKLRYHEQMLRRDGYRVWATRSEQEAMLSLARDGIRFRLIVIAGSPQQRPAVEQLAREKYPSALIYSYDSLD